MSADNGAASGSTSSEQVQQQQEEELNRSLRHPRKRVRVGAWDQGYSNAVTISQLPRFLQVQMGHGNSNNDNSSTGGANEGTTQEEEFYQRRKIYVGSLHYSLTEEHVRLPFSAFGEILNVDMPREGGRSRGYCFVEYATDEQAQRAMAEMDGFQMAGRQIKVNMPSVPKKQQYQQLDELGSRKPGEVANYADLLNADMRGGRHDAKVPTLHRGKPTYHIFVGSIYWDLTAKHVAQVFQPFGKVLSCFLVTHPDTGKHRGYGFVEFETVEAQKQALAQMDGFDLCGRKIVVNTSNMNDSQRARPLNITDFFWSAALEEEEEEQQKQQQQQSSSSSSSMARNGSSEPSSSSSSSSSSGGDRCIVLRNLADVADVNDADLQAEIKEECESIGGPVLQIKFKQIPNQDTLDIYVLFAKAKDAATARMTLDQRYFDDRPVYASFIEESVLN